MSLFKISNKVIHTDNRSTISAKHDETIRNIEENNYYSDSDLNEITEQAIYLSKALDTNAVISYINKKMLANTHTQVGSVNWYRNKFGG